jgi:hypothetical protein
MLEPEDSSASALLSALVDLSRLLADVMAAMFVFKLLMIILLNSFLESPLAGSSIAQHPCRVVDFKTGIHRFPDWPLLAANRHCLSTDQLSAQWRNTLARAAPPQRWAAMICLVNHPFFIRA